MLRSISSTPACTTMVNMGAVRAGDLVRPDAVAQIAAAPGAGDGDLHLGQASILARLELGQNRIAAVYGVLIGRPGGSHRWRTAPQPAARLPALYSFSQTAASPAMSDLSAAAAGTTASTAASI